MKKISIAIIIPALLLGMFVLVPRPASGQQPNDQPDLTIDAAARKEVIESVLKRLNDEYIFPEVAKNMETDIRKRVADKEYDQITSAKEFSGKLTRDLQGISKDKHLRIGYSYREIPVRQQERQPTPAEIEEDQRFLKRVNYGFEKIERLPGNIGYIDLRNFWDPEAGADTVAAAMNFVANTDALIFDLRENGGGDPAMVQLICSYLFDGKVHLNDLYWRAGNKTDEFWTRETVAGKRYKNEVYVLTSNRTFSGGEEFTYNLKNLKRATIVGETTGGGANPGRTVRLNAHFRAFVPIGRAISPITKTNWEGTGVTPDVAVSKDLALKTAHLMALNKVLAKTSDEEFKNNLKARIEQTQKELDEMKKKPN